MDLNLWGWIALFVLVILAGFSSAADSAYSRARRHDLREKAEWGNSRAKRAAILAEDSSKRLAIFQLSSVVSAFFIAGLLEFLLISPFGLYLTARFSLSQDWVFALSFIVIMFLLAILVFIITTLIPSVMVWRESEEAAINLLWIANLNIALFSPFVSLTQALRKALIDPLADLSDSAMVTEEEIMTLVDAGEEEGSIEEEEKEMIYSIFQLDETLVREIMVPRIDVVSVEIGSSVEDALDTIIQAGHSRLPVYDGSLDQIVGLLYAKDLLELLKQKENEVNLSDILRPAVFIPETKRVLDLLSELQTRKVHLAIVVDEYGGTAGIVTIEDIVEEIVGEIFDEYDEAEEELYSQLNPTEYAFAARIDLDDFNRIMDMELSDEMGDTLGGYIYGKMGKIPSEGDVIEGDHLEITVLVVTDRRIKKVLVRKLDAGEYRDHKSGKSDD